MLVRFIISVNGCELAAYEPEAISLNIDPDLLSSFLEAMELLSTEMKNPIQMITFSNWTIYINKGSDFTIRLIMSDQVQRAKIDLVFKEIREMATILLQHNPTGYVISPDIIKKRFVPILKKISREPAVVDIKNNMKIQTSLEISSRICLAGLKSSGKTSIKRFFLDHLSSGDALKIKPTLGVEITQKKIDFLHETLNIQELGGHQAFRQRYLTDRTLWNNISTLIYVVDLQKPALFKESYKYLHSIMDFLTEIKNPPFNLCLLLHKYDPSLRVSLANNLRQCLIEFTELHEKSSIHLTSLEDSSSNIAMIKSIYLSFPTVMLQKMLEEDFISEIKNTLVPRLLPLIPDASAVLTDEMAEEIRMSSVLFGRAYGDKFQTTWNNYLAGMKGEPRHSTSDEIKVKNEGNGIQVTFKKIKMNANLYSLIISGALLGMTRNLNFQAPQFVKENDDDITWGIQF